MNNEERILTILETLTSQFGIFSTDVAGLKADVAELKADVAELKADMVEVKADVSELKADMVEVKADVAELKADMVEVKTRITKVEVTQENIVLPRLQLLMEGHKTLHNQVEQLSVIDRLQDDVTTLKSAVRYLSDKVEKLEKAM